MFCKGNGLIKEKVMQMFHGEYFSGKFLKMLVICMSSRSRANSFSKICSILKLRENVQNNYSQVVWMAASNVWSYVTKYRPYPLTNKNKCCDTKKSEIYLEPCQASIVDVFVKIVKKLTVHRGSHRRCSIKMLLLKISQYSQKSICIGVSFLIKKKRRQK